MSRPDVRVLVLIAGLVAVGCQPMANKPGPAAQSQAATPAPAAPSAPAPAITDVDWNLVQIGEQANPLGAGGRPVTLRLDSARMRAAGFGGCNRYGASYTLRGDSLSFGPGMSTKMACPDGMALEDTWLRTLPRIVTFAATESTLTLKTADGPIATLRRP
jgi:heat shock protein HslJ